MNKLNRIKKWLYGVSFTRLMEREKINKYQIAKNSGISYQTLLNWEASRCKPTSRSAELVGRYLGLMSNDDIITELERKAADIKTKLERLK